MFDDDHEVIVELTVNISSYHNNFGKEKEKKKSLNCVHESSSVVIYPF